MATPDLLSVFFIALHCAQITLFPRGARPSPGINSWNAAPGLHRLRIAKQPLFTVAPPLVFAPLPGPQTGPGKFQIPSPSGCGSSNCPLSPVVPLKRGCPWRTSATATVGCPSESGSRYLQICEFKARLVCTQGSGPTGTADRLCKNKCAHTHTHTLNCQAVCQILSRF